MIAFLDTEFTDLQRPQLLSIGLVTLDGVEFYAELDLDTVVGRDRERASSDFVRFGGVVDQFRRVPDAACSYSEMGARLCRWLVDLDPRSFIRTEIAFDYAVDFDLMESVLRHAERWEEVQFLLRPVNVHALTGSPIGEESAEAFYRAVPHDGLRRHHALADARALRAAYVAVKAAAFAGLKGTSR